MRFETPAALLLVPAIAILAFVSLALAERKKKAEALFAPGRVPGAKKAPFSAKARIAVAAAGLALLAIAASSPQWGKSETAIRNRGRNLWIVLDVSRSMLADDASPNRLERAKADIMDLLHELKGDRAAVAVFRGRAKVLSPLTSDYAFLAKTIGAISIDSAPPGQTDIASALDKVLAAIPQGGAESHAIVLVSDGEDLSGRIGKSIAAAKEKTVPIFTVGLGDSRGSKITLEDGTRLSFNGEEVSTKLTESTLKRIARETQGEYIPLATASTAHTTLGEIYRRHLAKIAEREYGEALSARFTERYMLFLLPGIILLVAAASLSNGRGPKKIGKILCAIPVFLLASVSAAGEAPNPRALYNEALGLYAAGDAQRAWETASGIPGAKNPETLRLMGASAFKAAEKLEKEGGKPSQRLEWLERAASAFGEALILSEEKDKDRMNLAVSREKMLETGILAEEEKALEENATKDVPALLEEMLSMEREIAREAANAKNTRAKDRIAKYGDLAAREDKVVRKWIALKQKIAESGAFTNENALAEAMAAVERGRAKALASKAALEGADGAAALTKLELSEDAAFGLWVSGAEVPSLLKEDILAQTNFYNLAKEGHSGAGQGSRAYGITALFEKKFPEWAQREIENALSATNAAPAFTEENAGEISRHLESLKWVQKDTLSVTNAPERARGAMEALEILGKISELMPKKPDEGGGSGAREKEDEEKKEEEDGGKQNKEERETPGDNPQDQSNGNDGEEDAANADMDDVDALLEMILQREQEHESQKQKLRKRFPGGELRDW